MIARAEMYMYMNILVGVFIGFILYVSICLALRKKSVRVLIIRLCQAVIVRLEDGKHQSANLPHFDGKSTSIDQTIDQDNSMEDLLDAVFDSDNALDQLIEAEINAQNNAKD